MTTDGRFTWRHVFSVCPDNFPLALEFFRVDDHNVTRLIFVELAYP